MTTFKLVKRKGVIIGTLYRHVMINPATPQWEAIWVDSAGDTVTEAFDDEESGRKMISENSWADRTQEMMRYGKTLKDLQHEWK